METPESEWLHILESLDLHSNEENVFEKLKEEIKTTKIYKDWEITTFDKNHLFNIKIDGIKYQMTLLSIAAKFGFYNVVNKLIKHEIDLNKPDSVGITPLIRAINEGFTNIAESLIEADADTNRPDKNGRTALHFACGKGNLVLVERLIAASLNIDEIKGTLLSNAASKGHLNVVKYLLELKHLYETDILTKENILHAAAYGGNLDLVVYLVEERGVNVNVDSTSNKLHSPVIYAAIKGRLDIVKYLIQKDERLANSCSKSGFMALHSAIKFGDLELVKYLIEEKNNDFISSVNEHWTKVINTDIDVVDAYSIFGVEDFTGAFELYTLHYAAAYGHLDIVKYLTKEKKIDSDICDQECIVPLHLASGNGHLDVVKYLIEEQESEPDFLSNKRITALHLACYNGHMDVIKYFIEEKNVLSQIKDARDWTPIHFAALSGHFEVVKYLINKGAHCDSQDSLKTTPLHRAAKKGHKEIVKFLIEEMNCDKNFIDTEGMTPLYLAAANNHLEVVKYFVENLHLDVKTPDDENGFTPLYMAVIGQGDFDTINYLIEKGADPGVCTAKGRSILNAATFRGDLNVVKYVIEEFNADIESVDEFGHTPLSTALELGHINIVRYLIEEMGANIHLKDINNRTVLHIAVHSRVFDLIEYLVQKDELKKYINTRRTDNRWTPLYEAVSKGYLDIADCLLKNGALVNATDQYANTPLHKACVRGEKDMVELLIKYGAKINPKNNLGYTPLHRATRSNHFNVVKYLIEKGANPDLKDKRNNRALSLASAGSDVGKYLSQLNADNDK